MGTTVATNALLERKGDRTVFVTTRGFADSLRIAYQHRPKLFVRRIELPSMLYEEVIEIDERIGAHGDLVRELDAADAEDALRDVYSRGIRACAIVLMHGYRFPAHEQALASIAARVGFEQISVSHRVSPLIKLVARGDTTVADAYLSPVLRRYVDRVAKSLPGTRLQFMQSSGGLSDAKSFHGKDAILSGPAGGIVGAARAARKPRASRRSSPSTWEAPPPTSVTSPATTNARSMWRWPAFACARPFFASTPSPPVAARSAASTACACAWARSPRARIPDRPRIGVAAR